MKQIFAALIGISFGWLTQAKSDPHSDFKRLSEKYFEESFKTAPTMATFYGIHTYDNELEDFSEKALKNKIRFLNDMLREFKRLSYKKLDADDAIDTALIINDIQGNLLNKETLKLWQKDPDKYSSHVSSTAFSIMSRSFAPAEERLKSLI